MVQNLSDNRLSARVDCSTTAWLDDPVIELGTVTDVGLQGAFITTNQPLPAYSLIALHFEVDGENIHFDAEVVRLTPEGMGIRFLHVATADNARLREYVLGMVGHAAYRDAVERFHDAGASVMKPVDDESAIRYLLQQSQQASFIMLSKRVHRHLDAKVYHLSDSALGLLCAGDCPLQEHESVYVLYNIASVSYSFRTEVVAVRGRLCEVALPTRVLYSERRSSTRQRPQSAAYLTYDLGEHGRSKELEVAERSSNGLSLRITKKEDAMWPGVLLPEATYHEGDRRETLPAVVVQHVTRREDADGTEWFQVGVSFGFTHATVRHVAEPVRMSTPSKKITRRIRSRIKQELQTAVATAQNLIASRLGNAPTAAAQPEAANLVHFANDSGKPLAGLINLSWPETTAKVRAPVIVIAPDLGSRKEATSGLAHVLMHVFRQHNQHLAVLRFDGSNNVGDSHKDPGHNRDTKETTRYSVSGGIDDLVGAVTWLSHNQWVDPEQILVLSVGFSSIATRHALAKNLLPNVSCWLSLMGAADASNALMNMAAHIDAFGNYRRGLSTGTIRLMGHLVDVDELCRDLQALGAATLDDAKRAMEAVEPDVVWIAGTHDAYMDLSRTKQAMSVRSPGKRQIIEVDAGHVPRTSEEALSEFMLLAREVMRRTSALTPKSEAPSAAWLEKMSQLELEKVRQPSEGFDRKAWWESHMQSTRRVGDVWEHAPEYRTLIERQSSLVPQRSKVGDMGCGLGLLTKMLVAERHCEVTAVDFMPLALEHTESRTGRGAVKCVCQSVDGNVLIATRRWVEGELQGLEEVLKYFSPEKQKSMIWLKSLNDARVHLAMRGAEINVDSLAESLAMPRMHIESLKDMHCLSRLVTGRDAWENFTSHMSESIAQSIGEASLYPFQTGELDCIVFSLVLNYLDAPEDALAEAYRVLRPGGRVITSVYLEDADMSATCLQLMTDFEKRPENNAERKDLIGATRTLSDFVSQFRHLEDDGTFRRYNNEKMSILLQGAGFKELHFEPAMGAPPKALIAYGTK